MAWKRLTDRCSTAGQARAAAFAFRCGLTLCGSMLLVACSSSVSIDVDSRIPDTPLVEPLPIGVGVYYATELKNHVYVEDSEDRRNWRIETGTSQVDMFDRVINSMFEFVRPVDDIPAFGVAVDGVIVPRIDEVQFATPRESLQNFYEAWIRYKIDLMTPEGDQIATWELIAYGRSEREFLRSNDEGLNEAIGNLLRDAGSKFIIGFPVAPGVQEWIDQQMSRESQASL